MREMRTSRILIVDDYALLRNALRFRFEDAGFEVWEAADGNEAVRKAQELDPDLVILDFEMPVMNGCETARALKKITPSLPLLMFTSNEEPDVKHEASSSGILAIYRKTEGIEPLLANVNALLAGGYGTYSGPESREFFSAPYLQGTDAA
jgi:CheY-like chemotaxis protein